MVDVSDGEEEHGEGEAKTATAEDVEVRGRTNGHSCLASLGLGDVQSSVLWAMRVAGRPCSDAPVSPAVLSMLRAGRWLYAALGC